MSITSVDSFTSQVASKKQIRRLNKTRSNFSKKATKSHEFSYGIANAPIRKQVRKK